MADEHGEGLEAVLAYLKQARGFDFTGYKRSSVGRRVVKRMEALGIEDHLEYLDFLEVHPDEFAALFNTILINVTSFFRDEEAWAFLADEVLPRLLQSPSPDGQIRVWSAACASGEEPFTIAMLLAEALGDEQFRRRVKIYATDVDEEALDQARQGIYTAKDLEPLTPERRSRFFERVDQRFAFRKDLRRSVIFGRNDLVQDAPISRIDLLVCRNALMYFNAETQGTILRRFHFALRPTGYLFLGKSEMLLTRRELFVPVDLKRRVFTKLGAPSHMPAVPEALPPLAAPIFTAGLHQTAFEAAPVAQLVVDHQRTLVLANRAARELLGLRTADLGRPLKDLQASYRPTELRASLDAAFDERRVVTHAPIGYATGGEERMFEVRVEPLSTDGELVAAGVTFLDITEVRRMHDELERSDRELRAAYEALQSTVEELETTNEELQSTNEELETTNEELQSTNEELETMNEELQSSNEEMETTNDELRQRSLELNEANAFMETILTGMGVGVAVVDREQLVRIWNSHAEDLWGLRAAEAIGGNVLGLDIGLPVDRLATELRQTLNAPDGAVDFAVDATDRRGRPFACRLTVVPLTADGAGATAAVVLMRRGEG